ncbi:hypothetical protein [Nocardioides pantholopis]|uniref:hypothetical protein n=1 Tax=Nocardioides pantholopis TaxID=2483798 RepID=UPI0013DE0A5F|nr:hypothetical protein [Nocardioides pantholopis]
MLAVLLALLLGLLLAGTDDPSGDRAARDRSDRDGPAATGSPSPAPGTGPLPRPPAGSPPPGGVEVPSADAAAPAAAGGGPETVPQPVRRPLVALPLPGPRSAQGRLVAGFPGASLPLPPGSRVVRSSVAPQAPLLQVTLEAEGVGSAADVLGHYAAVLTGLAFEERLGTPTGTAEFHRGRESVLVQAGGGRGRTTYLLVAVLRARG